MRERCRQHVRAIPFWGWAVFVAVLLACGRVLAGGLLPALPLKPTPAAPPAPHFTVPDLGTLPGGQESAAYALNRQTGRSLWTAVQDSTPGAQTILVSTPTKK